MVNGVNLNEEGGDHLLRGRLEASGAWVVFREMGFS